MTAPVWLTATPPTPNGDLHLGHMAGPYVAVDVVRRFLTADGIPVRMTTGLDDHQSYVPVQGMRTGRSGPEVAELYGDRIAAVWRAAGIEFDRIVEPSVTPGYVKYVQAFFSRLVDKGAVEPRTRPLPYCVPCDRWLYEAYVSGGCPHCGAGSNGNACEACGRPNDCGDLTDPHCVQCGAPAELRDQTRLYLPLAPYADQLAEFWSRVTMPPHLRALCQAMAADGLPDIAVSHPSDWGVPVPVLGFEDQRIYVWCEMGPGYLVEYDSDAQPESGPVQFFGFDNGYFHAVLFPALFLAWAGELPLASAFVVNEFYRLSGLKFSTSRRHAVWAVEGLAEAGPDALRYHVLRDRPSGRQTSYSPGDVTVAREHLTAHWHGWLAELAADLTTETGGVAPDEPPSGGDWEHLRARLTATVAELRTAYSVAGFDSRRAVALLDEVVSLTRDFGYTQGHALDPAARRAALAGRLAVARAFAAWAAPALPHGSARLAVWLGVPAGGPVDADSLAPLPSGTRLAEPDGPLFGRPAEHLPPALGG